MPLPTPPLTIAPLDGSWAVYDATGKRLGTLTDEGFARAVVKLPEMVEALGGLAGIVKAFSYTTTLGRTQRERLDRAQALLTTIQGE